MEYKSDPTSQVVDILLSPNQKAEADKLERQKQEIDRVFSKLCDERVQDFNTLLFSIRPLEFALNELGSHVDGLQKSTQTIKDELMSTTNLLNYKQLEYKSQYYQDMIEGLQTFEMLERLIENIEFLSNQNNLLSASIEFNKLKSLIMNNAEMKQFLLEYGAFESFKKRVMDKQRQLSNQISQNLQDFLYIKSYDTCQRKLAQIGTAVSAKFDKLENEQQTIEFVCRETLDIKRMHDMLNKIHCKDYECAQRTVDLISNADETVNTGLICLQKDYQNAVEQQNIAYLTLLITAFKNVSDESIQESLKKVSEMSIQNLVERVINIMIKTKKSGNMRSKSQDTVVNQLLQMNANDLKSATEIIHTLFLFFQANLNYFMVIDRLQPPSSQQEGASIDFVMVFFYYFKMIIQILFDHDTKLLEFNAKQGLVTTQPVVEKNMRFSFRNREQMESFLTDSVRYKLDFFKTLEDKLVPAVFNRNISFVMLLSNRLTQLIQGIIESVQQYVRDESGFSSDLNEMQSFKGWMSRFIITNYEIYIDHFKTHSEFIAQKYFSNTLNANSLAKTNSHSEKLVFSSTEGDQQRVSIIRGIEQQQLGAEDESVLWSLFEYLESFSYIAQMTVEMIPIEDQKKQDQAQFRQLILEGVNKIVRRVYDRMQQVVNMCFNNTHKDFYFPKDLYVTERSTYYFRGLILKQESQQKGQVIQIEDQEFLYKPKLAVEDELLTNSMTTLTLLLQIYNKLNTVAIKEFQACYQFITSLSIWEQLLSESCKKEYTRYIDQLQNLSFDILVFMRCELTSRVFSNMRDMTRTEFMGATTNTQRVEPFAQTIIRDIKILHNFTSQMLGQVEVFYLFSHLQKFVFRLYGNYIRYIKRSQVDEYGFQRLKQSLFQLKLDFEMSIVPKLLSETSSSASNKLILRLRDEMKMDIAREYEKTIYIMQFLVCNEEEIPKRINDNDFGLTEQDLEGILNNYYQ